MEWNKVNLGREPHVKHVEAKSKRRTLPMPANDKVIIAIDPCEGLKGKELKMCQKQYTK